MQDFQSSPHNSDNPGRPRAPRDTFTRGGGSSIHSQGVSWYEKLTLREQSELPPRDIFIYSNALLAISVTAAPATQHNLSLSLHSSLIINLNFIKLSFHLQKDLRSPRALADHKWIWAQTGSAARPAAEILYIHFLTPYQSCVAMPPEECVFRICLAGDIFLGLVFLSAGSPASVSTSQLAWCRRP